MTDTNIPQTYDCMQTIQEEVEDCSKAIVISPRRLIDFYSAGIASLARQIHVREISLLLQPLRRIFRHNNCCTW